MSGTFIVNDGVFLRIRFVFFPLPYFPRTIRLYIKADVHRNGWSPDW